MGQNIGSQTFGGQPTGNQFWRSIGSQWKNFRTRFSGAAPAFAAATVILGALLGFLVARVEEPLILLAGMGGIFVFMATLASVEWGLLVLIFLTYTRFSDIAVHYHGAPSVARSFIFLLLLAILVRWFLFGEQPKGWLRPVILLGIYGLVGFASLLYAASPQRVEEALIDYVKDSIIAVLVVVLMRQAVILRRVIWTLLAAGIFMGTLSVFQYLTGTFENSYWGFAQAYFMNIVGASNGYRLAGPVGDPNFYAQVMVVLVPLGLERMLNERRPVLRFLAGWAMLVSAATVIFTMSRGGFLALVVMLAPCILLFLRRPVYLLLVFLVGFMLMSFLPARFLDRVFAIQEIFATSSTNLRTQDYALRGRASENLAAIRMFRDHPMTGIGWSNFSLRYQEYAQEIGLAPEAGPRAAHNLYLEIAAETGLLGLTAFLIILIAMARSIWSANKLFRKIGQERWASMTLAFGIGLLGYLASALFVHAAYPRYFWLLVGIALALPRAAKEMLARRNRAQTLR